MGLAVPDVDNEVWCAGLEGEARRLDGLGEASGGRDLEQLAGVALQVDDQTGRSVSLLKKLNCAYTNFCLHEFA